jgi:two-component system chemotaxis response regulator CheB
VTVSVLIVDDSGFFRKRLHEILSSVTEISVVGAASNGKEAIELAKKLHPDVITMDYEMPVMDGVTAVRHIMSECPTPILMFSSLTYEGARVTLDALEAGAVDFLPKNFEDIARDYGKMQEVLKKRILAIAKNSNAGKTSSTRIKPIMPTEAAQVSQEAPAAKAPIVEQKRNSISSTHRQTVRQTAPQRIQNTKVQEPVNTVARAGKKIKHPVDILLIGASTGGPVAIQKVLSKLPANFPLPILVVQHMPATFTPAFSERLNTLCAIKVKHAEDGDSLQPGLALIAPGAKQLLVVGSRPQVKIIEGDERLSYKPSVDVTFGSAAKAFPGRALGVVLTGMGADGREGCRMLKQSGSTIYTQSQKTCVIYGMPMAVDKAGFSDASIDLEQLGEQILNGVM